MVTPSYWPVRPSTKGILGHDEHFGLVFRMRSDARRDTSDRSHGPLRKIAVPVDGALPR